MKVLTAKKALSLMAQIVLEHGVGHVYQHVDTLQGNGCAYVQAGEDGKDCPSCLIGHVFHRFGVPLEFLKYWNFCGAETMSSKIRNSDSLGIGVTEAAVDVMLTAQESQDNGESWGVALARAVQVFAELENVD